MSMDNLLKDLRAEIYSEVNPKPKARVHSTEWAKIMAGQPVEINPTVGFGLKIMTVEEWSARWKPNEAFTECLNCGSKNTKEHHFMQVGGELSPGGERARQGRRAGARQDVACKQSRWPSCFVRRAGLSLQP